MSIVERQGPNPAFEGVAFEEVSAPCRLRDDGFVRDVLATVAEGIVVEDYPDYAKGLCVLVLQKDSRGEPMHVVWGIPKGVSSPAVLITAYSPDADRWEPGFLSRRK